MPNWAEEISKAASRAVSSHVMAVGSCVVQVVGERVFYLSYGKASILTTVDQVW